MRENLGRIFRIFSSFSSLRRSKFSFFRDFSEHTRKHTQTNKHTLATPRHAMMMMMATTSASTTSSSSKMFERRTMNITSARQKGMTAFGVKNEERRSAMKCSAESSSSSSSLVFDGTSMFTIYSELNGENVIFPSFLESALHVCEVSRSHPDYISAHFHEKVGTDQFKQLDKNLPPHQYMNYTLFDSPPEEVFSRFDDLFDSSDIAHPSPQKYAMLSASEVDVYPKNDAALEGTFAKRAKESVDKETKLTKIGLNDRNVAIVVALKCDNALDAENWVQTFGIGNLEKQLKKNFQLAVLHEVKLGLGPMVENDEASQAEGDATPFTHVVYASLGEVEDSIANDAVSLVQQALVAEGIADGSVVHAFKCAFNIAKKGTPCGALPAAREIQKRKEENEQARKNNKF